MKRNHEEQMETEVVKRKIGRRRGGGKEHGGKGRGKRRKRIEKRNIWEIDTDGWIGREDKREGCDGMIGQKYRILTENMKENIIRKRSKNSYHKKEKI